VDDAETPLQISTKEEQQETAELSTPEQIETGIEEAPRTPQVLPVREPEAVPESILDEPSILDPDVEWTDHEYGKSLDSIDESLEEIARDEVVPSSPMMVNVDNVPAPEQREVVEAQTPIHDDDKGGVQDVPVVDAFEESRELPGAFVLDEEQLLAEADVEPSPPVVSSSSVGLDSSEVVYQPSELERVANDLHGEISDLPVNGSSISPEFPQMTPVIATEDARPVLMQQDAPPSTMIGAPSSVEDSPELELVELLRSSQQYKEAQAQAVSSGRSVDGGTSDDFDGMSETVFSAANSGHPSDDEDLSSSWKWMKSSTSRFPGQSGNEHSSDIRMRRRTRSLSSAEPERRPSFLNPLADEAKGPQDGRKDEDIPLARSSSWAVSCFLCGVLVTLFVISTQRRDLLTGHRLT